MLTGGDQVGDGSARIRAGDQNLRRPAPHRRLRRRRPAGQPCPGHRTQRHGSRRTEPGKQCARSSLDRPSASVSRGIHTDDAGPGLQRPVGSSSVCTSTSAVIPSDSVALQHRLQRRLVQRRDDQQQACPRRARGPREFGRAHQKVFAQYRYRHRRHAPRPDRPGCRGKRRSSVSTLMIRAPPSWYSHANAAGSEIDASSPADGLARLTSAMTPMPGSRNAANTSRGAGVASPPP